MGVTVMILIGSAIVVGSVVMVVMRDVLVVVGCGEKRSNHRYRAVCLTDSFYEHRTQI